MIDDVADAEDGIGDDFPRHLQMLIAKLVGRGFHVVMSAKGFVDKGDDEEGE